MKDDIVVSAVAEKSPFQDLIDRKVSAINDVNGSISLMRSNAFQSFYDLTYVNIPSCSLIGMSTFASCINLETVYAPQVSLAPYNNNIQVFSEGAFQFCQKLSSIELN